jgi:methionyl-tRNA synthetase
MVQAGRVERAGSILYNTLEAVRVATVLLSPWLPTATARAWEQLGIEAPLSAQRLPDAARWGGLDAGTQARPGTPIFPRIETRASAAQARGGSQQPDGPSRRPRGGAAERTPSPPPSTGAPTKGGSEVSTITFDEFKKVELRVAEILEAKTVPGADKILELRVKIGDETRSLAAGIAQQYAPESLVGRKIIVVTNLQPRRVRGVESQGMLLAASHDGRVTLLSVDGDVPSGSPVS